MNCNKTGIYLILILMIFGINLTFGQNQGTTSLQFLKIIPSAKIMGMGETGVSIPNEAESVFLNVAGLANINNIDISFSTVDWFLDTQINSVSVAYTLGNVGTFGINYINTNYGNFDETRVDLLGFNGDVYNPGLTGKIFTAGVTQLGFSYAKALTDKFSFGVTANYIREDLYLAKLKTFVFNFGIIYNSHFKSLNLGIALRNIGPKVIYEDVKNSIPQVLIIGFSGYLFSGEDFLIKHSNNHDLKFAVDIVQPRDDGTKYHVGLDYLFNELIHFRFGYKFNYDIENFTFGIGVVYKSINVDYSYNDLGAYWDPAHRFTIGLSLL